MTGANHPPCPRPSIPHPPGSEQAQLIYHTEGGTLHCYTLVRTTTNIAVRSGDVGVNQRRRRNGGIDTLDEGEECFSWPRVVVVMGAIDLGWLWARVGSMHRSKNFFHRPTPVDLIMGRPQAIEREREKEGERGRERETGTARQHKFRKIHNVASSIRVDCRAVDVEKRLLLYI